MSPAAASTRIEPQRIQHSDALAIAGIEEHYGADGSGKIPAQWMRFAPRIGKVPGQKGTVAYGVCSGTDGGEFEYLSGVEVSDAARAGKDFDVVTLPPRNYAVFFHGGHVSALHDFCERIWSEWAPHADVAHAPFFERYDDRFDPRSGNGGVEVWIPLAK